MSASPQTHALMAKYGARITVNPPVEVPEGDEFRLGPVGGVAHEARHRGLEGCSALRRGIIEVFATDGVTQSVKERGVGLVQSDPATG
ncbi:unnamed protein product [Clonostachys rosea]|uniref:Uncharacterized protein n=1 Tax=Bionectria ochroleuca TaxID=29856 RepID=A0ABY6UKT3_BIOOC|nr:unnamed protein product [Clonostachys rosea]